MIKLTMQATTDMYKYLVDNIAKDKAKQDYLQGVEVFKDEDKPQTFKGSYIAINALPFVFGNAIADNTMNINVHCPNLTNGEADRVKLGKIVGYICSIIPTEGATDDSEELLLQGAVYTIRSQSRPISDTDNTHFVNLKTKIKF